MLRSLSFPFSHPCVIDEMEEDDDNVHAFEIKDDKIDVRTSPWPHLLLLTIFIRM